MRRLEPKFDLIFEEANIWDDRARVSEFVRHRPSYDDAKDIVPLSDRLLDPTHVSGELAHRAVGTARALQLKHDK